MLLAGKTIVVTGGNSGIGEHICLDGGIMQGSVGL